MNLKEAIFAVEYVLAGRAEHGGDVYTLLRKHLLPWLRSLESAQQEHADLQATFDLRHKADMRAIKRWQAAHPGKELTWPDHADLVCWLLEQIESQQGEDARPAGSEQSGTTPVVSKSPQAQGHGESSSSQDSLPPASALTPGMKADSIGTAMRTVDPDSSPPQPSEAKAAAERDQLRDQMSLTREWLNAWEAGLFSADQCWIKLRAKLTERKEGENSA